MLWGIALILVLGVGLTVLWWLLDAAGSPVLYIALTATLTVYLMLIYLGWGDNRRGSPARYWTTILVPVISAATMLLYTYAMLP